MEGFNRRFIRLSAFGAVELELDEVKLCSESHTNAVLSTSLAWVTERKEGGRIGARLFLFWLCRIVFLFLVKETQRLECISLHELVSPADDDQNPPFPKTPTLALLCFAYFHVTTISHGCFRVRKKRPFSFVLSNPSHTGGQEKNNTRRA